VGKGEGRGAHWIVVLGVGVVWRGSCWDRGRGKGVSGIAEAEAARPRRRVLDERILLVMMVRGTGREVRRVLHMHDGRQHWLATDVIYLYQPGEQRISPTNQPTNIPYIPSPEPPSRGSGELDPSSWVPVCGEGCGEADHIVAAY